MSALEFVAALISSLAWPGVVVISVIVLRKQLRTVLEKLGNRLKKISGKGFEAEFHDALPELEKRAALAAGQIYGGTIPTISGGEGERRHHEAEHDVGIEARTKAGADVDEVPESGEAEYVPLDPTAGAVMIQAKNFVKTFPRDAVVLAGSALDWSLRKTLDSVGVPYRVDDARGPSAYVAALRNHGVVDGIFAETLNQLCALFQSALRDSGNDVTGMSAFEYVRLVELALRTLEARTSGYREMKSAS